MSGERDSFRFKREERLKGRNEIREVFSRGKRFGCRGAKLFVLKNSLSRNRICFTFSRGFGNAVERNRTRRLGREAYRYLRPRLAGGCDLILLVYPETAPVPAAAAKKNGLAVRTGQLSFLLTKAGLL
ncbi:MAG: ribonuclease P protein component [Treponema sp.]|nr:ribonuclease P protein component [Treponema sp.]